MSSSLAQGTLVTIIGEAVMQDRLIKMLTELDVSGYTIIPAKGAGSHGRRMGDIAGYNTNIEITTIVSAEVAAQLMDQLRPLQDQYAIIAFQRTVEGLFD